MKPDPVAFHLRTWLVLTLTCLSFDEASAASRAISGQLSEHAFSFGRHTYRYSTFSPAASEGGAPRPALLLIHGSGGRGLDMLKCWRELASREGILLVAPDFPLDAEFETTVPQLFPALMDSVNKTVPFDSRRVYVFGYSAGGYSTFDAATLDSTYFAAAGVFASIISPEYDGIVLTSKRKTPIAIYIGAQDQFFSFAQTRRTRDLLESNQFPVHYVEMPHQDHNYPAVSSTVNEDVWQFMRQYSVK